MVPVSILSVVNHRRRRYKMARRQSRSFTATSLASRPTRSQEMSRRERQLVWLMFESKRMAQQNIKPDYFWVEESDLTGKDNAFRARKKDQTLVTYRSLSSEDIYGKAEGEDGTESVDVDSQCSLGDDESDLSAYLDQGLLDAISSPDGMGFTSTPGCEVGRELIPRTSVSPLGWLPCYAIYPKWLWPEIQSLLKRESDTETSFRHSRASSADFSTVQSSTSTVSIQRLLNPTAQAFVPSSPYALRDFESGSCQETESSLGSWSGANDTSSSEIKRLSLFSLDRDNSGLGSNSSTLSRSFWHNLEEAYRHSCCFGITSNPCWFCSGHDDSSERAVKRETKVQYDSTLKLETVSSRRGADLIKNVGQDSEGKSLLFPKDRKPASMHASACNSGCRRQLDAPTAAWRFFRSLLFRPSLFGFALIAILAFSGLVAGQNNYTVNHTIDPQHTKAIFQVGYYIARNNDFTPYQEPAPTCPALDQVASLKNFTPNPQHVNNIFQKGHRALASPASDSVTPNSTDLAIWTRKISAPDQEEPEDFDWETLAALGLVFGFVIGALQRIYVQLRNR